MSANIGWTGSIEWSAPLRAPFSAPKFPFHPGAAVKNLDRPNDSGGGISSSCDLFLGLRVCPLTVRTHTGVQNSKLFASCHKATVISWVEIERGSEGRLKGAGREGQGRRVVTVGLCMGCVIKLVSANSFCLDTVFLYRMTNTHCFMLSLHVLSNFASVWYMPLNCLRSLFSVQPPWWDG